MAVHTLQDGLSSCLFQVHEPLALGARMRNTEPPLKIKSVKAASLFLPLRRFTLWPVSPRLRSAARKTSQCLLHILYTLAKKGPKKHSRPKLYIIFYLYTYQVQSIRLYTPHEEQLAQTLKWAAEDVNSSQVWPALSHPNQHPTSGIYGDGAGPQWLSAQVKWE